MGLVCGIPLPGWAYVPGKTGRHPEGAFDLLRLTARPGMSLHELRASDAWRGGLLYLSEGYFWEAHELLEPVWMALPQNAPERALVQAVIQLANAGLKQRMQRPGAAARLVGEVRRHADEAAMRGGARVMGIAPGELARACDAVASEDPDMCIIMHKFFSQTDEGLL